jgi:glutamine phosphoribosylpyrophosphate amidotransferase
MSLFTINSFEDDHLLEECEFFGIFGFSEASINTALRFSEAANISFVTGIIRNLYIGRIIYFKKMSEV